MSINDKQIDIDGFDDIGGKRNWYSATEIEALLLDFVDDENQKVIALPLYRGGKYGEEEN